MFEIIVSSLIKIEQNKGISYEEWFPEHNPELFNRLREEVLIPKKHLAEKEQPGKILLKRSWH